MRVDRVTGYVAGNYSKGNRVELEIRREIRKHEPAMEREGVANNRDEVVLDYLTGDS